MNSNLISTPKTLRLVGTFTFALAILTVLTSVLAYLPANPDFSIFTTYLSDIGDTGGWPQILFNSGTILAAPLRYIIIVLLILRLRDFTGREKGFEIALLVVGAISTVGTVLMTAVPFSVAPTVHKSGIGFYFLGVVFLQFMIGRKEMSIKALPRILTVMSFLIVACFLIFFVLIVLHETGFVTRNIPVFWEWMCFFTSTGWLLCQSIILGHTKMGRRNGLNVFAD
jgi:hypothetical membrane protein